MKILIRQFLGELHSWSMVGHGIAEGLLAKGHDVHLFATDGIKHVPTALIPRIIGFVENGSNVLHGKLPDHEYDCQISYTAMINFPRYLANGSKNRFGIWCYEWDGKNVLPNGFAKHYKSCDKILAPSNFAKEVFVNSGVPVNCIEVISHGISSNFTNNTTIKLPTKRKFKILAVIAQNHLRKNISGMLDAYGKAFTDKDDVCLIIKGKEKPITQPFDVSLNNCLKAFYNKYPKHAEVKVFSEFIEDMSMLYRSIDVNYTLTNTEGFYMPGQEALASGKLNIAPNYGGQLDFLNETNALLVSGKKVRANPTSMYWENKNNAIWFQPDIGDAADKLKYAYQNYEELNKKIELQRESVNKEYSWDNITNKILRLCK